ncbi:molybdate ABC transporter substrate-binding protein [Nocardioides ginkgobilobae]|uniref:molybdate ABC transporter substrate-binding protein n=1 Tax=Nocardioides sp. TaxID=35761 RepID=UPI00261CFFA9|nr:molybdate ABC transporter substrate-binding protein [Nocardioides sp.]
MLTVYAAASLTSTFTELAERFEADNPGVTVALSFAGSSDLVAQVISGAPADVLASADLATMDQLTAEDLQGSEPEVFATNTLQIAVPPDNPGEVSGLADLAEEDLAVVVCAPEVPCGAAAVALAGEAGTTLAPDSEEQSVADVLGKVRAGEADAGLVYVTDVVAAASDVLGIDVPEAAAVVNDYPVATVAGSDEAELAQAFVDLVLGEEGRQVLADAGFGTP